jgi:hypothetical protein
VHSCILAFVHCSTVLLLVLATFQPAAPRGVAAVIESVLWGYDMPPSDRTAGVPADVERGLETYRERERLFESTVDRPANLDGPEGSIYLKRVRFEHLVFSLFDRPESMRLAGEFGAQIRLVYEWEGLASSPLAEAESADLFLRERPDSPITAYVQLFAGHRKLCALSSFEGLDPDSERAQEIAREADAQLRAARDSAHPLIRIVAEHLIATRSCRRI